MSKHRVLSVGQCGYDHGRIARHFRAAFHAEVRGASTFDEALAALQSDTYDLVLVNRVQDLDGKPGLELIRALKADPELASVPVMLVSNYPDAQADAQALGALPGFGKSELESTSTGERLRAILGG